MTKYVPARTPVLLPWTLVDSLLRAKAKPRHVEAREQATHAVPVQDKDEAKDLLQRLREAGL
jgi:hypothetical protein